MERKTQQVRLERWKDCGINYVCRPDIRTNKFLKELAFLHVTGEETEEQRGYEIHQDLVVYKRQRWDLNSGYLVLKPMLLSTILLLPLYKNNTKVLEVEKC